MPGVKGRSGVHGRQGRRRTDFRGLALAGIDINEPTMSAADVTIWRCSCGAVWWEPYMENVWGNDGQVGEVAHSASTPRHTKICPNRG